MKQLGLTPMGAWKPPSATMSLCVIVFMLCNRPFTRHENLMYLQYVSTKLQRNP